MSWSGCHGSGEGSEDRVDPGPGWEPREEDRADRGQGGSPVRHPAPHRGGEDGPGGHPGPPEAAPHVLGADSAHRAQGHPLPHRGGVRTAGHRLRREPDLRPRAVRPGPQIQKDALVGAAGRGGTSRVYTAYVRAGRRADP